MIICFHAQDTYIYAQALVLKLYCFRLFILIPDHKEYGIEIIKGKQYNFTTNACAPTLSY